MLYIFCSKAVASAAVSESNISTISNNANGGCTQVSVSPNNTTVGISPCGAVPKSIEVEVDAETEIIETRNGTADFWLLPNLAESY